MELEKKEKQRIKLAHEVCKDCEFSAMCRLAVVENRCPNMKKS